MDWLGTEFKNLDLGDKRNNARAINIVNAISKAPQSSIPKSCQGWAETQATYRFYANESVQRDALIQPHYEATEARIRQSESAFILCLQDTTELNFNGQQIEGMGRLSYDAQEGCTSILRFVLPLSDCPLGSVTHGNGQEACRKKKIKKSPRLKKVFVGLRDMNGWLKWRYDALNNGLFM